MPEIQLTMGFVTLVDPEYMVRLSGFKWVARRNRNMFYAFSGRISMHRYITQCSDELQVDHINGDSLDNRRANLRMCTVQVNTNGYRRPRGSSVYRGVSLHKASGKWQAKIRIDRKRIHIGLFDNEIEAALAFDRVVIETRDRLAQTNFPRGSSE